MRQLFAIAVFLLGIVTPGIIQAQTTSNASIYTKVNHGEVAFIPWYVYNNGNVFAEARIGFDQNKTVGLFGGKTLKLGKGWSVTPELGGLFGEYNGFSPEVLVNLNSDRTSLMVLNQYSVGSYVFAYHFAQGLAKVNNRFLIGGAEQVYLQEPNWRRSVDVGPMAKIVVGKVYVVLWPSVGTGGARKTFVGLGYKF